MDMRVKTKRYTPALYRKSPAANGAGDSEYHADNQRVIYSLHSGERHRRGSFHMLQ